MIEIPDFLKPDFNKGSRPSKLAILIKEYNKKFGKDSWSTEGIDFSKKQLEEMLEKCLQENRTFYDVIGIDLGDLEEDEEI